MREWVLSNFFAYIKQKNIDLNSTNITFLGYTFKENCSDIRNTKVRELILSLKDKGVNVSLWDPLLDIAEIDNLESQIIKTYRAVPTDIQFAFLCVPHDEILEYLEAYQGLLFDYKKVTY